MFRMTEIIMNYQTVSKEVTIRLKLQSQEYNNSRFLGYLA